LPFSQEFIYFAPVTITIICNETKEVTFLITIRTMQMKKSFLFFATAFLAVSLFFAGCKKEDSTPTTPPDTTPTKKTDQPIPEFGGAVDGVVAAIQFSYNLPGVPAPYNIISMDMGFANFGDGTDAGTVTVNGEAIAKITSGSTIYYNSFASTDPLNPPTSLDLNWNGSTHAWSVAGAGSTPAFTINVTSPSSFTISNPTSSTVASKTSNLTVTWSGANASSADSVMIFLLPLSGTGTTFTTTTTNRTGSYTIPSSQLSAISGDAMLEIVKYRYATTTVSSKTYVGVAEIVNTVSFKIQ